jgi:sn1-specific diacylglycerol lipase
VLNKHEPVYQAVWANNTDFDEVLISPVMIQDHMPDNVLNALNKVTAEHISSVLYHSFDTYFCTI